MYLELTEIQKSLQKTARSFLENEYEWTVVRDLLKTESGYSAETWAKMADLGWMGLIIPEDYEGAGLDLMEMMVVIEEMGRVVCPGPYVSTALIGAKALLLAGNDEQKKQMLPQIAAGKMITSFALQEANPNLTAGSIKTVAELEGDDYIIRGNKMFIRDAHIANYLICVAKTTQNALAEESISLFLVPKNTPGISCTRMSTMSEDGQCQVVLDQVKLPKTSLLGPLNGGWAVVQELVKLATLAECAYTVGVGQKDMEMTVQHSKDRVQFGVPVASFQAIKHHCADMYVYVEQARWMTFYAIWKIEQGMPATLDVSRAKVCTSDAIQIISRHGNQIHAGVGFTLEHPLHLYFRRAKTGEVMYGNPELHRNVIANALL